MDPKEVQPTLKAKNLNIELANAFADLRNGKIGAKTLLALANSAGKQISLAKETREYNVYKNAGNATIDFFE
jgi:hypothetical protein